MPAYDRFGSTLLMQLRKTRTCVCFAFVLTLFCPRARADEGGYGFWFTGQFANFSAVPAPPGVTLTVFPILYSGVAKGQKFIRGGQVTSTLKVQASLMVGQLGYAPQHKLLGGQLYTGMGWGGGFVAVEAKGAVPLGSTMLKRDLAQQTSGITDLYPITTLAWTRGYHNWMGYTTADFPVGTYSPNQLAYISIHHFAFDTGGSYTFLNPKTGTEFSGTTGLTFNAKNPATHYRNGVDWHLDWAVGQFVSESYHLALQGYVYQQVSPDSYPTEGAIGAARKEILGAFKTGVASFGPGFGALLKVAGHQAYFNLRGYWEFWAQNRYKGYAIYAILNLPLYRYYPPRP